MRYGAILVLLLLLAAAGPALSRGARANFTRVFIVVLENANESSAIRQPFLRELARQGAALTNYHAVTHPSQPNYLALTSGSTHRVHSDRTVTLDAPNIVDLLTARGHTWKAYVEDYPGGGFLGAIHGRYARKHNPFVSYRDIQVNPRRMARVVDARMLDEDVRQRALPDYAMYIPNLDDDGHDTSLVTADRFMKRRFDPLLKQPAFRDGTLFVVTFDEAATMLGSNRILTVLWGSSVIPGSRSALHYTHYSLLRTIEEVWGLGTLRGEPAEVTPIRGIWR